MNLLAQHNGLLKLTMVILFLFVMGCSSLSERRSLNCNEMEFFESCYLGDADKVVAHFDAGVNSNIRLGKNYAVLPTKRLLAFDAKWTPLMCVSFSEKLTNRCQIAELLIEGGSNLELTDSSGATALHYAANGVAQNLPGAKELFLLLLEKGANPNVSGGWCFEGDLKETPLHLVISDTRLVQELLSANADPNVLNTSGETPLHEAVQDNNYEVVKLLLNAGANPSLKDRPENSPMDEMMPPLFVAVRHKRIDIIKLLVEHGANVREEWKGISLLEIVDEDYGAGQKIKDYLLQHLENIGRL